MKHIRKIGAIVLLCCIAFIETKAVANASIYNYYTYKKGDRLYTKQSIVKGKRLLKKGIGDGTQYLLVEVSGGKATLHPQKGYWCSDDPYFKKKKITCKISPKCKFYYRNVEYPTSKAGPKYKKLPKNIVLENLDRWKEYIEEAGGYYYTGICFGEVYIQNGKIVAVLKDGGD